MFIRAIACLVVGLAACSFAAPADAQWRRLDTPNFVFVSDIPAKDLREVAARFEGFREALNSYIGARASASIMPTVVIVFSTDVTFSPFKPRRDGRRVDAAGVFLQGRQVNYIAFAHADEGERGRVLMHELAHLVVSNSGQDVPVWLHEGLAEFYSTLAISTTGDHALVGSLIQLHLNRLRNTKLLTLEELLTITPQSPLYNEGSRKSVFYAQAWALTHMLHNGQPKRETELNAYLERLSAGMPPMAAWKAAFGDADVMGDLERYIRRLQFTAFAFPLSGKLTQMSAANAVDISRSEADAFLAQVYVRQGEYADAETKFLAAEKREPENLRARIGRALLDQERGDIDQSAARLAAIAPPEDWLLAYQAGMALAELVHAGKLPPSSASSATVRSMFAPAIASGRLFPSIAAALGQVEMRGLGQPSSETHAAIDRARAAAPGYVDLQFVHAQALIRAGQLEAARQVLSPFDTANHPPEIRDLARRLLTQIAARDARGAGRDITSRVAAPDEQRSEGTLHSIECAAATGITFHVTLPAAEGKPVVATFIADRLDDVQLVSHRDDFTGTIACGSIKEPMPVRVSWRPVAGGSRRAVAIEFLPKRRP
jgi:hypothetical protein